MTVHENKSLEIEGELSQENLSNNVSSVIASNLRYYRKKKGMTQKQLAGALNVTNTAISNWEKGSNSMGIDTLSNVCAVLDVSIDEMCNVSHSTSEPNKENVSVRLKKNNGRAKPQANRYS